MGIPKHTKIILVPGDDRETRQYGISRPMIVALIVLMVLMATLVVLLMVSFAGKHTERQRIREMETELAAAMGRLIQVHEVHIDRRPRNVATKLRVQMCVRPIQ